MLGIQEAQWDHPTLAQSSCPQLLPCQGPLSCVCTENRLASVRALGRSSLESSRPSPCLLLNPAKKYLPCWLAEQPHRHRWAIRRRASKQQLAGGTVLCCAALQLQLRWAVTAGASQGIRAGLARATNPFVSWGVGHWGQLWKEANQHHRG